MKSRFLDWRKYVIARISTTNPNSEPRIESAVEFQMTTCPLAFSINAGIRLRKYQISPYEDWTNTFAAMPQPSVSPTSPAHVMIARPTNGSVSRISPIGIAPRGTIPRTSTSNNEAAINVSQGTMNITTVEISFAVVYCIAEIGRL